MRAVVVFSILAALAASACGGSDSPSAPSPVVDPKLTAPAVEAPADGTQLDTLRPTLIVRNGSSDQSGTRTYEFQISETADFSTMAVAGYVATFRANMTKTGVPEDPNGKTSFALDQDLQPTTLFYWRARLVQGSTSSEWSAAAKFRSKLVGFFRAGELYDPLIHGETVGAIVGGATFIPGKGLRLDSSGSYVSYKLPEVISTGEFSMEVEGLRANASGNKTKVYGMQEGQGDFITNRYRVDVQYPGIGRLPAQCHPMARDVRRQRTQVRTDDRGALCLGIPPRSGAHLFLEVDVGQRVPHCCLGGWLRRHSFLQQRQDR